MAAGGTIGLIPLGGDVAKRVLGSVRKWLPDSLRHIDELAVARRTTHKAVVDAAEQVVEHAGSDKLDDIVAFVQPNNAVRQLDNAADKAIQSVDEVAVQVKTGASNKVQAPENVDLPELDPGYHYRHVGDQVQIVRNPGKAAEGLPALHLENGEIVMGPSPGIARSTATRSDYLKQLDASN